MGLENDIPNTPYARQTTITLANAVRMINLLNVKVKGIMSVVTS